MGIDTSMYQTMQPAQAPDVGAAMQRAMTLSNLGLQNQNAQLANQQAQYQMQGQQAMRQAFADNTDENGNLNRQGAISQIARVNPQMAMQLGQSMTAMDKSRAEAQKSQMESTHATLSVTVPAMKDLLTNTPPDQRAAVWPKIREQLINSAGVDPSKLPDHYDEGLFQHAYYQGSQMKEQLDNTLAQTSITEKQAQTKKDLADAAKTESETYERNPGILGQNNDPAQLVPYKVPKDLQPKVYEEIKTAEDTKALTPKILAAFEKGSSRNPIVAAQGQREFEGLINTTVKDTEGTARQAAFDSIHHTMTPSGLTASPGENATKRRTVIEYLQSKQSAPIARSRGIDLRKFDSTSPYQDKQTPSTGDSLGGNSAYASDKAPTFNPGAIVMDKKGNHYTVGPDGETLVPVQGKR